MSKKKKPVLGIDILELIPDWNPHFKGKTNKKHRSKTWSNPKHNK